jgi:mutual gliding-motility protein MglA
MATINYAMKEISVKIVYYGPGLSGKTTNLQIIHRKIPLDYRSDMVSLATETDRTLFFDFLPIDLGNIKGFSTKFQLYTVPGQVYYNATRKLVLRGVDGVVFVADSAEDKLQENLDSFQNLHDNLLEYGIQPGSVPIVLQYNKRDLHNALPVDLINNALNKHGYQWNEAVASQGTGVFESLKIISKVVIDTLNRKYSRPLHAISSEQPISSQRQSVPQGEPAPLSMNREPLQSDPYGYSAVNHEPAEQLSSPNPSRVFSADQKSRQPDEEKTDLDIEIEKYQREIEEKQRRLKNLQSAQSFSQPVSESRNQESDGSFSASQEDDIDVFELPEEGIEPPSSRQPSYDAPKISNEERLTDSSSFIPDRQHKRKKIKRGASQKTKVRRGFWAWLFKKDKSQ